MYILGTLIDFYERRKGFLQIMYLSRYLLREKQVLLKNKKLYIQIFNKSALEIDISS